jgi:hypothetical protein
MMISDEQARLAAQHLSTSVGDRLSLQPCTVSQAVIDAAIDKATRTPDVRAERVAEARERMVAGIPDPRDVANKMLSRIIGDSLR